MPLNPPCPEGPAHCFCGMEGDDTCCLCMYVRPPRPVMRARPAAQVRIPVVEPQVANWADQFIAAPAQQQFVIGGNWVDEVAPISWDVETLGLKPKKKAKPVEPEDDGSLENVDWTV